MVWALAEGEGDAAATLAACRWAECRPNSLPAQETLFELAADLDLPLLAERAGAEARRLGGKTPGFPLTPDELEALLAQPDGSRATPEELMRLELGELHLEAGDYAAALAAFEGLPLAAAQADRAVALFHLQRIDEALAGFEEASRLDPSSLHSLTWARRLRLFLGDEPGARALGARLAECRPSNSHEAIAQIDSLLLVGDDRAAWDAFLRALAEDGAGDGDGAEDEAAAQRGARLRHRGGAAAARLGMEREALAHWREALELDPELESVEDLLDESQESGRVPPWPEVMESVLLLPDGWLKALEEADEADEALDAHEADLPALAAADAYLGTVYRCGDPSARWAARLALVQRASDGAAPRPAHGPGAAEVLKGLARLPIGSWLERLEILQSLLAPGPTEDRGTAADAAGRWPDPLQTAFPKIHQGPYPHPLPPDLERLLADTEVHLDRGRPAQAESGLLAILAQVPDHPLAAGRLAALRAAQGRSDESLELLRQAAAAHPESVIARCNLACALSERGDLAEAERQLAGIAESPQLHQREIVAFLEASALLAAARGDARQVLAGALALTMLATQGIEAQALGPIEARVQRILLARLDGDLTR
jgi:tetratricopeptide (TPR) repeat protein